MFFATLVKIHCQSFAGAGSVKDWTDASPAIDEQRRRRFEKARLAGKSCPIEDFLPDGRDPRYLDTLIELVCVEFEIAWKSWRDDSPSADQVHLPRPLLLEAFLDRFPELRRRDIRDELIREEYHVRLKFGDRPSVSDYRVRFPDCAELVELLDSTQRSPRHSLEHDHSSGLHFVEGAETDKLNLSTDLNVNLPGVSEAQSEKSPSGSTGAVIRKDIDLALTYTMRLGNQLLPPFGRSERDELHSIFSRGVLLDGRYRIHYELGRGGMGVVYMAHDERLDRSVAIKATLAKGLPDPELRERFFREARYVAGLSHPGIAAVYDFGFHCGVPFAVFEFVHGATLREVLKRRGTLPMDEVASIASALAIALDAAHNQHITHRDLKPDNIKITADGECKILDFGLATQFNEDQAWTFAGTAAYAAPEQAAEQPVDGRADQYALAVIIFELLTGHRPFTASNLFDLLRQHRQAIPPSPRHYNADISETVNNALLRALEKDPQRRFANCEQFVAALGCTLLTVREGPTEVVIEGAAKVSMRWGTWVHLLPLSAFVALTATDLWIGRGNRTFRLPLRQMRIARSSQKRMLIRIDKGRESARDVWVCWRETANATIWREELRKLIEKNRLSSAEAVESSNAARTTVDPQVVLIRHRPRGRFQFLGQVSSCGNSRMIAASALQVYAAIRGSHGVTEVAVDRVVDFESAEYRFSGLALRTVDARGRQELGSLWYSEQLRRQGKEILAATTTSLLIASIGYCLLIPETGFLTAAFQCIFLLLIHIWPLVAGATTATYSWPQFARPAAGAIMGLGILRLTPLVFIVAVLPFFPQKALDAVVDLEGWRIAWSVLVAAVSAHLCGNLLRTRSDYHKFAGWVEKVSLRRRMGEFLGIGLSGIYVFLMFLAGLFPLVNSPLGNRRAENLKHTTWERYRDNQARFTLEIPAAWEKSIRPDDDIDLQVASESTGMTDPYRENIVIAAYPASDGTPPARILDAFAQGISDSRPGFEALERGEEPSWTAPNAWLVGIGKEGPITLKTYTVVILGEDRAYSIHCTAQAETFEEYRVVFQRVAQTFVPDELPDIRVESDGRVHHSLGFSIALPLHWRIQSNYRGAALVAVDPAEVNETGNRSNLNVFIEKLPQRLSAAEYCEAAVQNRQRLSQLRGRGQEQIGEESAPWVYFEDGPLSQLQYFFVRDGDGIVVTCTAKTAEFPFLIDSFREFVRSCRIQRE